MITERYCGREASDKVLTMDNYAVVRFVSGAIPHLDDDYYGFISITTCFTPVSALLLYNTVFHLRRIHLQCNRCHVHFHSIPDYL
jgi:hypothetical protein